MLIDRERIKNNWKKFMKVLQIPGTFQRFFSLNSVFQGYKT